MSSIASKYCFVNCQQVRGAFERSGVPIAEWARARGYSVDLVYQVLEGRRRCLRGQSHKIAVELGLKDGQILSLEQLSESLLKRTG